MHRSYDVVIVGGAIIGSSVAWFLSDNPDFDGSILVIERDPTYERSSTTLTNSCMRQQFSNELNIRISQFGADYVTNFRHHLGGDPEVPDLATDFERIKLLRRWVGHYAYNTLDHNAVVGRHHEVGNFIFANGFSGRGLQQSPAMGRGVAELITYGEYRTLDLGPLGYDRMVRGEPFIETAII